MDEDLYREMRREAMDHLSFSPSSDSPDRESLMILKGHSWAMLVLADAVREATVAFNNR